MYTSQNEREGAARHESLAQNTNVAPAGTAGSIPEHGSGVHTPREMLEDALDKQVQRSDLDETREGRGEDFAAGSKTSQPRLEGRECPHCFEPLAGSDAFCEQHIANCFPESETNLTNFLLEELDLSEVAVEVTEPEIDDDTSMLDRMVLQSRKACEEFHQDAERALSPTLDDNDADIVAFTDSDCETTAEPSLLLSDRSFVTPASPCAAIVSDPCEQLPGQDPHEPITLFLFGRKSSTSRMFERDDERGRQAELQQLQTPLRLFVEQPVFEFAVLFLIAANTASALLQDHSFTMEPQRSLLRVFRFVDVGISALFLVELVLKALAYGVVSPRSTALLFSVWHTVDTVGILAALVDSLLFLAAPHIANVPIRAVSAFRIFRFPHTLQRYKCFSGTKGLMTAMRSAAVQLAEVFLFLIFFLAFFGVFGVEAFGGSLQRRCVIEHSIHGNHTIHPPTWCKTVEDCTQTFCGLEGDASVCTSKYPEAVAVWCSPDVGPPLSLYSFNNILFAMMMIFHVVSLDDWSPLLQALMQAEYVAAVLYFLLVVVFLTFVLFNLLVAVITATFEVVRAQEERARLASTAVGKRLVQLKESRLLQLLICCLNFGSRKGLQGYKERWLYRLIRQKDDDGRVTFFELGVICVVMANTVVLAMEYENMPPDYAFVLGVLEIVFTGIFLAELLIKIVAYRGLANYLHSINNMFDFFVVLCTLPVLFQFTESNLSMLRMFRLLRILRILRNLSNLERILVSCAQSIPAIINLFLYSAFTVVCFAFVGMKAFGGRCCIQDCVSSLEQCCASCPSWNFNSLLGAMMILFQIATGESWFYEVNAYWDQQSKYGTQWFVPVYFLSFFLFLSYVVLNLFIAIVLGGFGMSEAEKQAHAKSIEGDILSDFSKSKATLKFDSANPRASLRLAEKKTASPPTPAASLLCISASNPFRRFCNTIVDHPFKAPSVKVHWFEHSMTVAIVVSSCLFCLEDVHLRTRPVLAEVLVAVDIVFFLVFLAEFIFRIVARGFLFLKSGYMREIWGVLDLVVLVATGLDILPKLFGLSNSANIRVIRVLRIVRVLRPLRVIKSIPSMQFIVNALLSSLKSLFSAIILVLVSFFIFGILAVNIFRGELNSCSSRTLDFYSCSGVNLEASGILVPLVWERPHWHFDHLPNAFLILFEVAAMKYAPVVHSAVDVNPLDPRMGAPQPNASRENFFFFGLFIFVSLFCWSLFTAVIIDHFNQATGWAFMTEDEKMWVAVKRTAILVRLKARKSENKTGKSFSLLARFFRSKRHLSRTFFKYVVYLNAVLLCTKFKQTDEIALLPTSWTSLLFDMNFGFVVVYTLEAVVKMVSYGRRYFKDGWHVFEFALVLGSWLDIILALTVPDVFPFSVIFRNARVFRIIRWSPSLRSLFKTLLKSFAPICNVLSLIILLYFVFAIIGLQVFPDVQYGLFLSPTYNFRTFGRAMLTLFVISTGADWTALLRDMMVDEESCTTVSHYPQFAAPELLGKGGDTCGSPWAPVFMVSFIVLNVFVMLNLFVAMVLESFAHYQQGTRHTITFEDVKQFKKAWKKFDTEASGAIRREFIGELVTELRPPLGFTAANHPRSLALIQRMAHENTASRDKQLDERFPRSTHVHYHQLLLALAANAVGLHSLPAHERVLFSPMEVLVAGAKADTRLTFQATQLNGDNTEVGVLNGDIGNIVHGSEVSCEIVSGDRSITERVRMDGVLPSFNTPGRNNASPSNDISTANDLTVTSPALASIMSDVPPNNIRRERDAAFDSPNFIRPYRDLAPRVHVHPSPTAGLPASRPERTFVRPPLDEDNDDSFEGPTIGPSAVDKILLSMSLYDTTNSPLSGTDARSPFHDNDFSLPPISPQKGRPTDLDQATVASPSVFSVRKLYSTE